jgi:hypothetical protein
MATTRDDEAGSPDHAEHLLEEDKDHTLKHKVYLLFEDPHSSWAAFIMVTFILLCIVASSIAFCLETVPELQMHQELFLRLEVFFVTVFTIEYVSRFWSSVPDKMTWQQFMFAPLNVIDILSILPFFVDLFVIYYLKTDQTYDLDLRFLRALRLLRVFKIGRHSSQLSLIGGAMIQSLGSLFMLALCLVFALVIFSTLIFIVERGVWDEGQGCYIRTGQRAGSLDGVCSPFESIPVAAWWAITTMTTVGYGDTYPITNAGRAIGGLTMIIGILCVALPTTILGVQFSDNYGRVTEQKARDDLKLAFPDKESIRAEMQAGMRRLEEIQAHLQDLLPVVEKQLLIVTKDLEDKSQYKAVESSFSKLSESALKAADNSKRLLKATLPEECFRAN